MSSSAICDIIGLVGFTMSGFCAPADNSEKIILPQHDESFFDFKQLEPAPVPKVIEKEIIREVVKEQTPPPPPPVFPPVIIEKKVVVHVPADVPPPPPPPPAKPDPIRTWLENGGGGNRYSTYQRKSFQVAQYIEAKPLVIAPSSNIVTTDSAKETPNIGTFTLPETSQKKAQQTVKLSQEEYEEEPLVSSLPVDNTRILTSDRYITGIIETSINTQVDKDHEGEIIIQVARNVYGYHGRSIIVPKGSRMECGYEGPEDIGSTRISINCKRILMGEYRSEIANLNAPVADQEGNLGISGEVDNKFSEKYGTAFILAGISGSVRLASAFVDNDGDDEQSPLGQTIDAGSQELSQKLGEISAAILENTVNLKPIIKIAKGTRVTIRLSKDWVIQKPQPINQSQTVKQG